MKVVVEPVGVVANPEASGLLRFEHALVEAEDAVSEDVGEERTGRTVGWLGGRVKVLQSKIVQLAGGAVERRSKLMLASS